MTWEPPELPPADTLTNATLATDTHPEHHNLMRAALAAVYAILGDDPAAGDASLSAAVKGGRHHYLNFIVKTNPIPEPTEEVPDPADPFDTWLDFVTGTPGVFPLNPDAGWHMYVFSPTSKRFTMLKLVPDVSDPGPNEDPDDMTGRIAIMEVADFQPIKDDLYNSRIFIDQSLGESGATFNQHRLWYIGNDLGPSGPHNIVLQGVMHDYVDAASAVEVHPETTAYQGLYFGDTGNIGDTTEDFDVVVWPADIVDDSTARIYFNRKNMNHQVRALTTINGVENPEIPVGASTIAAHFVAEGEYEWRWENVPQQAAVFPASVILACETLTPTPYVDEENPATVVYWVDYFEGWNATEESDPAGHNDYRTVLSADWTSVWARDNAPTFVLLLRPTDSWPILARITQDGFTPVVVNGGSAVTLSCGGAAWDSPTIWFARNNGSGDNIGSATAPHLPADYFIPFGVDASQVSTKVRSDGLLNGELPLDTQLETINAAISQVPYRTATHNETAPAEATVLYLDASSQDPWQHNLLQGFNLPDGKVYRVHRVDTSANVCTLELFGSDVFHLGGTSLVLHNNYAVDVRWDATLGIWWANTIFDSFD